MKVKVTIAILALALAVIAEASYVPYNNHHGVATYDNSWPLRTSTVWPAYGGLYGKTLIPEVAKYGVYPEVYGAWPSSVYGKTWGYSAPVVAAAPAVKVVDNGLWNYGGYGYGSGYNKCWL